jgi:hypothetical protein
VSSIAHRRGAGFTKNLRAKGVNRLCLQRDLNPGTPASGTGLLLSLTEWP